MSTPDGPHQARLAPALGFVVPIPTRYFCKKLFHRDFVNGPPGKARGISISFVPDRQFVYWNGFFEHDTDLYPAVPDDMRVIDKTIPDVDQVESGRDILVSDNNARARVGDIADAAIETVCSIGKGNDAAQQDAISPLGPPLDRRRHGAGGLGHIALLVGRLLGARANRKYPTGIGFDAQSPP